MNHEQQIALREAHGHTDENAYFAARPEVADSLCRRVFRHGHERGFDAAVQALRDLSWAPAETTTLKVDFAPVHNAIQQLRAELEDRLRAERPQMATLVDRFLSWPLPSTVCTDGYTHVPASVRRSDWTGSGTNLLSGVEAEAMLAHVLEGRYVPRPAAPLPASADQWLSWSGGDCPLPRRSRVEVQLRNGRKCVEPPHNLRWAHDGDEGDIVRYRRVGGAA